MRGTSSGERLRGARLEAGLVQGGIPGYSASYVSRVEAGERPGGRPFWAAAAKSLGVSEQWLLTGSDDATLLLAGAQQALRAGEPGALSTLRGLLGRQDLPDDIRTIANNELVDALMARGRVVDAIPVLRVMVERPAADPLQECRDRMRLARCLAESGDLHAAVDVCTPALGLIEDLDLQRAVPAIQLKVTLAGVLTMRGDLLTARQLLAQTEIDAALSGSDEALASVLWNAAHLARERGLAAESERLARRAVQLFDQAADMHRYAATLVVWADVALDCESPDLETIESRLDQGMELIRQYGDALEIGYACHDLARLRAAQGRSAESLAALAEALACLGPENVLETARCLITRVAVALAAGHEDLAMTSATRSRELLEQIPANYRTARKWTALAEDYYAKVGDTHMALQCYRNAAAAWQLAGVDDLVTTVRVGRVVAGSDSG